MRTKYGRNLRNISEDCDTPLDELTKTNVKQKMKYKVVPETERWRTSLVDELLGAKFSTLEIPLSLEEREAILSFACSS